MPSASFVPAVVASAHLWWWTVTSSVVGVVSVSLGGRRAVAAESAFELVCFHTGGL